MNKWLKFAVLMVVATLLLVACNTTKTDTSNETPAEQGTENVRTLQDATGKDIAFEEAPTKIITTAPSITETLFALGLDEEIIGVSDNDTYPEQATQKEKIGGMTLDAEKIVALAPDVVFIHETSVASSEAAIQQLNDAGVTAFVVPESKNFDETYDAITLIGEVVDRQDEAQKIVTAMQEKVQKVVEDVKALDVTRTVFLETSDAPSIYTAGNGSYIQEMFDLLGATNIAKDGGDNWFEIDPEAIVQGNPDVIIVQYDYVPDIIEKIKQRDGFSAVEAVKNDRIVQVDVDSTSRTGPRLADGFAEIAKAIYPEAF